MMKAITVSTPGKALLVGGYCVLEAPNPGLVFATDSCFHVTISTRPIYQQIDPQNKTNDNDGVLENYLRCPVDVYSPQFHQVYCYFLYLNEKLCEGSHDTLLLRIEPRHSDQPLNPYVQKALLMALTYVHETSDHLAQYISNLGCHSPNEALAIRLLADNDFYSSLGYMKANNLPISPHTVSTLPPFLPCPKDEDGRAIVNKTGLGSSATLVSSLVGAILVHFQVVDLEKDDKKGRAVLHNLAQIAHSLVQGKIGSGFDVSAALYGSHIYTRFNPIVIKDILACLEQDLNQAEDSLTIQTVTARKLVQVVQDKRGAWNSIVEPLAMPKGLEMMMADVCGGSESPSMARKVIQWKRERLSAVDEDKTVEERSDLWELLLEENLKIKALFEKGFNVEIPSIMNTKEIASLNRLKEDELKQLAIDIQTETLDASDFHDIKKNLKTITIPFIAALRHSFIQARSYLKQIGEAANVPIEPDEQTDLANLTMDVPGVIAAGVPGAGGYDALYVIYIQRERNIMDGKDVTRGEIGRVWEEWCFNMGAKGRKGVVCPLKCQSIGFGAAYGLHQRELEWS